VVKAEVCKTSIRRFESARRLHIAIDLEEASEKRTFLWGFFAFGDKTGVANTCEIRKFNDDASVRNIRLSHGWRIIGAKWNPQSMCGSEAFSGKAYKDEQRQNSRCESDSY
jgi:hypothetical protein